MRHSKRQIGKLRGSLRADESDGHGYYRQRLEWEMTKAFWHLLDSPQSPNSWLTPNRVRRERWWSTAGVKPARELVRSTR